MDKEETKTEHGQPMDRANESADEANQSEEIIVDDTSSSSGNRTLVTAGTIAALVVVAAGVFYFAYQYPRNMKFNSYVRQGQTADAKFNYSAAMQDYQQALAIRDKAVVKGYITTDEKREVEHQDYLQGKSELSAGNYSKAVAALGSVKSYDKQDYASAQQLLKKAAITAATKQAGTLQSTLSMLSTEANVVSDAFSLVAVADYFKSPRFPSDLSAFDVTTQQFSSDIDTLKSEIASFNTDAKNISSGSLSTTAKQASSELNQIQKDYQGMSSFMTQAYNTVKQEDTNFKNGNGSPRAGKISLAPWNQAFSDLKSQSSKLHAALTSIETNSTDS